MKKGMFLTNWEIALCYDVLNFVAKIKNEFEHEIMKEETELSFKLDSHIETVRKEWEESSEEFKTKWINMTHEERIEWQEEES